MNESSTHNEISLLLSAVAMGTAAAKEQAAVDAHVAQCAVCEEQLMEFHETVGMMHALAAPVAAPEHLKLRVMDAIEAASAKNKQTARAASAARTPGTTVRRPAWTQKKFTWAAAGSLATAACAAILALPLIGDSSGSDPGPQRKAETYVLQTQIAAGADSSVRRVSLKVNGDQMQVDGLPAPADGRAWQLWSIDKQGVKRSLALMDGTSGSAPMPTSATLVAITDEPAQGSKQPTTEPVVTARV